jgi:hypothetical protein
MAKITLDAYAPDGRLIAKCDENDYGAPLLMSLHGEGSTIRVKNRIVWLEGADGEGAESYDGTIAKIFSRLKN